MYNTGLILEGGGMRGVFTAGVLDFFINKNIYLSDIYGVSAGACHACSYISKQYGRAFATAVGFLDNKKYCSIHSLVTTGDLFGKEFAYYEIPRKLNPVNYDTFRKYKGRFYATVTNLETGKPEYIRIIDGADEIEAIRASASLPLMSNIVEYEGKPYLDGGIGDSIPLKKSMKDGNKKNIVILTQPRDFVKEANKMMPLIEKKYKDYPNFIMACYNRHNLYNATLDLIRAEEKRGNALVIAPEKIEIKRIEKDADRLQELYKHGYESAESNYKKIKEFLK